MGLKNESGMLGIGVALMLIVVLALFGGVLWQYSMVEMKRAQRIEQDLQAFYLARAGAEASVAAWLERDLSKKPEGKIGRIYFDTENKKFTSSEPVHFLGYVDVVVQPSESSEEYEQELTEFVATAVVGDYTKTVRLKTYPHLMGHDESLKWYDKGSGVVKETAVYLPAEEMVIMQPDNNNSIYMGRDASPTHVGFAAPVLYFKVALDFARGLLSDWAEAPDWFSRDVDYRLPLTSNVIFLQNVRLINLPKRTDWSSWISSSKYSVKYGITLNLLDESEGIDGDTIGGQSGAKYGKVYFDDEVRLQELMWERERRYFLGFIPYYVYRIIPSPGGLNLIKDSGGIEIKNRAYYFKHGTDLYNLQPYDLIFIEEDASRADELKELNPVIWE